MKKFVIAVLCFGLVAPIFLGDFSPDAQAGPRRRSYSRPKPRPAPRAKAPRSFTKPTNSNKGTKPRSKFDAKAGKANARDRSKQKFTRSTSKKSTFTVKDPKTGKSRAVKIDRSSASAKRFSGSNYTSDRYASRGNRQTTVIYNSYYGRSYPGSWGMYGDGLSPYFWLYMMSLNSQRQAAYLHNHGSSLDQARLNDLYAKNASLQAEVNAMKGQPVDPNYVPEGMDKENIDLIYSDGYAQAASGYQAAAVPAKKGWGWVTWLLLISIVCGGAVWYFFFYRRAARGT